MPIHTQPDKDKRQTSSGKGFFRRHKDKDGRNDVNGGLETASAYSVAATMSSRHSKRGSVASQDPYTDQDGLAMTAGVITSIPYDTTSAAAPVSVDYLPREEHMPQKTRPTAASTIKRD